MSKANPSAERARPQTKPPFGFTSSIAQSEWESQQPEPTPPVPTGLRSIRGEVNRELFEAIPHVQVYRSYQRKCIRKARQRYPETTGTMADHEVWDLIKPNR